MEREYFSIKILNENLIFLVKIFFKKNFTFSSSNFNISKIMSLTREANFK